MGVEVILIKPDNPSITLSGGTNIIISRYDKVNNSSVKCISTITNNGIIKLWEGETDVVTHFNDTEQQLEDKLKEILET
jgi:hypothetical protein